MHAPSGTPLADIVHAAGARWAIEETFQAAKNEAGLDPLPDPPLPPPRSPTPVTARLTTLVLTGCQ
ncbi:hypothetical protein BLA24_24090 [Streptomyces cinnamoneus]|uniref:Transposase IS4-like domain-containing protein n=1 Tax=Streptomyces cinnamoneus TaxID=53446 RepID=A0A2G1XD54_STRCJ|nr:hypothetical protein BLA24_24090 [Streptomyces cinnamoneus]